MLDKRARFSGLSDATYIRDPLDPCPATEGADPSAGRRDDTLLYITPDHQSIEDVSRLHEMRAHPERCCLICMEEKAT
jgi:hypothetical protein